MILLQALQKQICLDLDYYFSCNNDPKRPCIKMTHRAVEFVVKHLVVGAGAVGLAVGARLSREVILC